MGKVPPILLICVCIVTSLFVSNLVSNGPIKFSSVVTQAGSPELTDCHSNEKTDAGLPSGWDYMGQEMYREEKKLLVAGLTIDPKNTYTHQIIPLQPVRSAQSWFSSVGMDGKGPSSWEPETIDIFLTLASGCRFYVGFGTWIGPTLFFAAQLVDEAYGIEADPVAFARVETNLALNKDTTWARHVHLNHHAIGLGSHTEVLAEKVKMTSGKAGNSCSGLGEVSCVEEGAEKVSWTVNTFSLPSFLMHWHIPVSSDLFIKIDTESFECNLIPSWNSWLKAAHGPKPIFFIAFHSQIVPCTTEQYKEIYEFAQLFDVSDSNCMDDSKKTWVCETGEYPFYDHI